MRQMEDQREARRSSARWASLLSTVAAAARAMPLDRNLISGAALDTVLALGFDGASLSELDEEAGTYRILGGRGIPDDVIGRNFPSSVGVTGMVLSTGATVVLEDYAANSRAIPPIRDQGFRAVMATPLWIKGWMAAVLVGGSLFRRRLEPLEVQAFELLAGQTSLALENAMRYEEEHDAVERLRELDAMKSDFLATVSHELRTPVTVIRGAGVTLERTWDTVDDETRRQLLAGLNSNALALNRILNTLLDFSRVERGAVEIQKAPIDRTDLLERTAVRLGGLFDGRHLLTEIEPDLAATGDA